MTVNIEGSDDDIYRDRGQMFIRLNRRINVTMPTGLYCCEIPVGDIDNNLTYFCIGIYNRESGE